MVTLNAEVVEGHPCEREDGIVGGNGHNQGSNNMLEFCVKVDVDPLVTPYDSHIAETQGLEGGNKSNCEPVEAIYTSDEAQLMEKVTHFLKNGDSLNAQVIEGNHPYERGDEMVADNGHNNFGDNMSEFSVEPDVDPLVTPFACHRTEDQRFEGANSQQMEAKYIRNGAQMVEKFSYSHKNGDSLNSELNEGHPYESEGGIVRDDGHNHDGDIMLESCGEANTDPFVTTYACHIVEAQELEGENKSNCEPLEFKYISDGTQLLDKAGYSQNNGNSVNFDLIEEHPYEREGKIIGDDGHKKSEVNSGFSAKDQNMIDKGLACIPESVETALDQHSTVDSNQVEVYPITLCVDNCQKIYDKNNNVVKKTVLLPDPFPITEQDSGSQQMEGDIKNAFVCSNAVGYFDVTNTSMALDAAVSAEAWCPEHSVVDSVVEKEDLVMKDNRFAISDSSAELQNEGAQQNIVYQNQKEESFFMMGSLKGEDEAHASHTLNDSSSPSGSSIHMDSAKLDNPTLSPRYGPLGHCQDFHSTNIPSMEQDKYVPEHGVDEATDCFQSLQHKNELDNLNEGCINTSTESSSTNQQATYDLSFPEKEGFSTSDLVWGKVKSHPWWPGQIFDFSGASKLALKYQKKDHFLVAYFGDKTFAWCEESRLKHFQLYFSQMVKQTTSDSFLHALHDILLEISRRVELSMACLCLRKETYADIEYQKVENAGVRGKIVCPVIDRYEVVNHFHPDKLLKYVKDLAQLITGGVDRLEHTVAQAQLKAYSLSKGYTELPSFINGSGLVDNDFEIPTSMSKSSKEVDLDHSATLKDLFSTKGKSRARDGTLSKQNHIVEDSKKQKSLSELMEVETAFINENGNENVSEVPDDESYLLSSNKRKTGFYSSAIESIKKNKFEAHIQNNTKLSLQTFNSSFKVGEFISRAACKLTCGQPFRKCYGEQKHDWAIDYMDIDDFPDVPFDKQKVQIDISEYYLPANEMLSKLCLAARNPLKGYNFSSIVISFFSAFRNLQVSNMSLEVIMSEKPRAKRGRKKKIIPEYELPDSSTPDHMKDSYWSDMIVPEKDAVLNPKCRGRKKKKFIGESQPSQILNSPLDCENKLYDGSTCQYAKHILIAERPIVSVEEKIIDELTPTAMILYFNCSDSLPSETDLIRTFSRYGPLKEDETSIEMKNNSATVVFKKRADAEMAFSNAGKYSTFGPALLSYRLRHFPVKSSLINIHVEEDAQPIKDSKQGIFEEPESKSAFGRNLNENIPTGECTEKMISDSRECR